MIDTGENPVPDEQAEAPETTGSAGSPMTTGSAGPAMRYFVRVRDNPAASNYGQPLSLHRFTPDGSQAEFWNRHDLAWEDSPGTLGFTGVGGETSLFEVDQDTAYRVFAAYLDGGPELAAEAGLTVPLDMIPTGTMAGMGIGMASGTVTPETGFPQTGFPQTGFGALRRLHYGPGPHPGTGTEQQAHAGDGGGAPKQVGITSARPGKAAKQVFREMREFDRLLREIKGVRDVSVTPGLGGWEGGREPTWIVSYRGNGKATQLLAETAKRYDQDAVILIEPGDKEAVVDWQFNEHISPEERDQIETVLAGAGIGGWSWYRTRGDHVTLRAVSVSDWGGSKEGHLKSADEVNSAFESAGYAFRRSDSTANVTLISKESDYAIP